MRRCRRIGRGLRRDAGVMLMDILISLAIICMVTATIGVAAFRYLQKAREDDTRLVISQVESAVVVWQARGGDECPAALGDLVREGYLKAEPRDGWGRALVVVRCPGEGHRAIDLLSKGHDGREGTEDDITSASVKK